MTTPVSNINRTNLNALDPNLATGQVADPALRKACFDEIYNYFDTFVTSYNAFISGGIATANIADFAITTAKLALLSVTAAQIANGTITTTQIADGTLLDADVNPAAAIAWTKISKASSSLADLVSRLASDLTGTLNAAQMPALTGDITTLVGTIATTLKNTGTAGTYKSVTTDAQGRVTAGTNPTTLLGYGITDAAPSSHVGTGGTAHANVIAGGAAGFMIGTDKTKLDGISAGAEVNQNTFSIISVAGQSDVVADQKSDALTLVNGTGITITTNPATDAITITATGAALPGAHASTHVTGGTDVIANAVAGGNAGLMSGADKTQVNLIAPHLADYTEHVPYAAAAGSVNVYTATLSPALASYTAGVALAVNINITNTGPATINVNGLGAKSIIDSKGNAMTAGKLRATSIYTLRYNGTDFILQGEGGGGNAVAAHILAGETATVDSGDITGTMVDRSGATQVASGSSVAGTTLTLTNPANGFQDTTSKLSITDADFIAANILSGINMFGLIGTAEKTAHGTLTLSTINTNQGRATVTGLSFTPTRVILYNRQNVSLGAISFDSNFSTTTFLKTSSTSATFTINADGFVLDLLLGGLGGTPNIDWTAIG